MLVNYKNLQAQSRYLQVNIFPRFMAKPKKVDHLQVTHVYVETPIRFQNLSCNLEVIIASYSQNLLVTQNKFQTLLSSEVRHKVIRNWVFCNTDLKSYYL